MQNTVNNARTAYDGQALAGALGLVSAEIKVQARVFNTLAGRKATAEQGADYFCRVMEVKPDDVNRYDAQGKPVLSTKLRNQLNAIADAYLNGPGATLDSAQGTLWGALNAVTYYADHKATVRDTTAVGRLRAGDRPPEESAVAATLFLRLHWHDGRIEDLRTVERTAAWFRSGPRMALDPFHQLQ